MTDLAALIAKLEAATEGSRELDAEIAVALDPRSHVATYIVGDFEPTWFTHPKRELPHFSTSLDAALSIVPVKGERYADDWTVERITGGLKSDRPWVRYEADIHDGDFDGVSRASPAAALCIAALKARASLNPTS